MKDVHALKDTEVEALKSRMETLRFAKDFDIAYQNQILPGIVILLNGELQCIRRNVVKTLNNYGSMIGWDTLKKNSRSRYLLRIKAGTEIILIGRSGIEDLKNMIPDLASSQNPAEKRKRSQREN